MKYLIGSVELVDNGDSICFMGSAHVESGKLDERTYLAGGKPMHELTQIELPDGAVPLGIIPARDESGVGMLQWYKPIQ